MLFTRELKLRHTAGTSFFAAKGSSCVNQNGRVALKHCMQRAIIAPVADGKTLGCRPLEKLMPLPTPRNPWIDACKGLACAAIVAHHIAFYGPMSDIAQPLAPHLVGWLYDYGRMAVQIFLVLGGYLAAASLAPTGVARFDGAPAQIARRFMRLVVPYAAALAVTVLVSALVRPWLSDDAVPGVPSLLQVLANALMLQDVLQLPALSAGVWYVAIDLQLFACAALLLALARRVSGGNAMTARAVGLGLVLVLCAASLWWFNRNPVHDIWAWYYFGAYGLGMAAYWASRSQRFGRWALLLAVLGVSALALEVRPRLLLALATVLVLLLLVRGGARLQPLFAHASFAPLVWVGQRSYSIFLIHFSVCLAVNAVFAALWPGLVAVHWLGLVMALGLSLLAGRWLYERIERREASPARTLRWQLRLASAGVLAMWAEGLVVA